MKKQLIFLSITIILFCTGQMTVNAQGKNTPQFGIKGGVNFSKLHTNDDSDSKMLAGYHIGLFGKVPVGSFFALQPEIYFTTKGAEVTYNGTFVDGTARFRFDYVEMPLLIVANITDNFNVQVGPYAAYLVSGRVRNEANINLFNFEENINTDDYNRVDAGLVVGIGIDFESASAGVRYNYGLTKVGKERTFMGTMYTFPDANNGVLNFYLAVPLVRN